MNGSKSEAPLARRFSSPQSRASGSARESCSEVFRDLVVYGDPPVLGAVVPKIEALLADGWYRDREIEASQWCPRGQSEFCFVRSANSEFPAIVLVMHAEGRSFSVTAIVAKGRAITCAESNAILVEFYLRFLHSAAPEAGSVAKLVEK